MQKYPFATLPGSVTHSILVDSEQIPVLDQTGGFDSLRATYILDVSCNEGKRDPAFAPAFEKSVRLDKTAFFERNYIRISPVIGSSAYLTFFNYDPLDAGEVVLVDASRQIQLSGDRKWSYEGTVHLPKGVNRTEEVLIVVATLKPFKFSERMTMEEFNWILGTIPIADRREVYLPYTVEKLE